jgi:UDP-glucuronate decarboxylase
VFRARFRDGTAQGLLESNWRVVVVGGSGWLGMAALEMLHGLFGADFSSRVVCFGSAERELVLRGGVRVPQAPLSALARLPRKPSVVLHLAFLTQDKISQMPLVQYLEINRSISSQVLAVLESIGARAVFLPSSGAVYRTLGGQSDAYGALKLEDEAHFGRWAECTGSTAVIARVFNLSGPYINKQSTYALASFILNALRGEPTMVKATQPVFRSYVAIEELMSVAAFLFAEGPRGVSRFDTAGEEVIEVGELAARVGKTLNPASSIRRPPLCEHPADRYVGNPEPYRELRRLAGVEPIGLEEQILSTAQFIADDLGLPLTSDCC